MQESPPHCKMLCRDSSGGSRVFLKEVELRDVVGLDPHGDIPSLRWHSRRLIAKPYDQHFTPFADVPVARTAPLRWCCTASTNWLWSSAPANIAALIRIDVVGVTAEWHDKKSGTRKTIKVEGNSGPCESIHRWCADFA